MGRRNKQVVRVIDLMDYFGEFINEEQAEDILRRTSGVVGFAFMNGVRDMLKAQGHDVPFRSVYRRANK